MHAVFAWSGFVGAWLLVAGPLFQAAVEMGEEEEAQRSVFEASKRAGPAPRLSPWWWLLPPVAYVKQVRARRAYRKRVFDALSRGEIETFVEFTNVATGWAMVALGASFIGVKETWELVETSEWPGWLLPVLVVVMLALCAINTVTRVRRNHAMIERAQARPAGEP